MSRLWSRGLFAGGLALGLLLMLVAPAGAVVRPRPSAPPPAVHSNTDLTMSGTGPGEAVFGFIAGPNSGFDPTVDPYPSATQSNPPDGFTNQNEGFAGVIYGQPTDGSPTVRLYCIDIDTYTWGGIGYGLGTWDASHVPNVGYVARILNEYYPKNPSEPAGLSSNDEKAAAVQAAIWFFSDRYALSVNDPLYATVVAIVDHIRSQGPLLAPDPPSLTLTPAQAGGPAGRPIGPFTLTTDQSSALVTATGGTMYSNRAGTVPIGDGTTGTVSSGQKIWVRARGGASVVLQATALATVPSGNVYLYDGNWAGVNDAQRLILSKDATLTTTVTATATFQPSGSLEVTKSIAGPAAGTQGSVVIHVICDDGVTRRPFVIRAAAHAGTRVRVYRHILAGTMCTVVETRDGSVVGTNVVVTGNGETVMIPAGGTARVHIADDYHAVGSLLVTKTIAGPAAGQEGQVTIHSECNGTALTPDFVIPAGAPAGNETKQYDDIPAASNCVVTETADGHTSTVSVVVEGSGQTVPVIQGDIAQAGITDTYGLLPGELEVTKTITGPLAGRQGAIIVHTVCNGTAVTPDLVIPAGTPAGNQSQIYSGISTPATCVVTETAAGQSSAVPVAVTGSPQTVTIAPAGSGAAHITDTYGPAYGSLAVTKAIAGPLAGRQGPITIHAVCNGTALSPDFVIAAGTPAGEVSHSFDGLPAGAACTVSEIADGTTTGVEAITSGSGQTLIVPAGDAVPVTLVDVYHRPPSFAQEAFQPSRFGRLKVVKTIAGPAARQHGPIAILVSCGGPRRASAFLIPAGTGPGTFSRTFGALRPGSRCVVTETRDGHTGTVVVASAGKRKTATIAAGRTATVHLTDTFASRAAIAPFTGLG